MPARKLKCSYREGNRRCPSNGAGNPPLCRAHQLAVAEASKPRRPAEVLAEAAVNFLQGKPINREATIGAVDAFINQWSGGLGAEYYPPVNVGESEGNAHRRAQSGPAQWWWPGGQRGAAPPPEARHDPQVLLAARRVLGFTAAEVLDADTIKSRRTALAKKYHPDRAGDDAAKAQQLTARMAAINQATDLLLQSLRAGR